MFMYQLVHQLFAADSPRDARGLSRRQDVSQPRLELEAVRICRCGHRGRRDERARGTSLRGDKFTNSTLLRLTARGRFGRAQKQFGRRALYGHKRTRGTTELQQYRQPLPAPQETQRVSVRDRSPGLNLHRCQLRAGWCVWCAAGSQRCAEVRARRSRCSAASPTCNPAHSRPQGVGEGVASKGSRGGCGGVRSPANRRGRMRGRGRGRGRVARARARRVSLQRVGGGAVDLV